MNVVTSSIRVASILSAKKGIRIVVLGGTLVANSLSVRDDYSLMGLDNIHAGILLADSSKLGRIGFGRIAGWEEIDSLITDSDIPAAIRCTVESLGVKVLIA